MSCAYRICRCPLDPTTTRIGNPQLKNLNLFLLCRFRIMSRTYATRNFDPVDHNITEIIENVDCIPMRREATPRYNLYGAPATASSFTNAAPIRTKCEEDTYRYVHEAAGNIYWSSNPIITRPQSEGPIRSEQQITLKCLQPPPLREPEPNVIIEKRPEQPPLLPPLIIHEREETCSSSQQLIFRERPPSPPDCGPPQITERCLPPVPVPPRSLVVERFPPMEKPRDIIIERWLPYGPFPERRTIVRPAPPPINYPNPTHTLIIHDKCPVVFVDKFQCLGVVQEDPEAYKRRYGSSLLDPRTLVEEVRRAGVTADITCPCDARPCTVVDSRPILPPEPCKDCYCAMHGTNCPKVRQFAGTQPVSFDNCEVIYDCEAN
ncbi:unnamed protein product [Rotaria socialis]